MAITLITPDQIASAAGGAVVIGFLLEAIKRLFAWTPELTDRFGAITALALGVLLFMLAAASSGPLANADVFNAVMTGLLSGATSIGLYHAAVKPALEATNTAHANGNDGIPGPETVTTGDG